MAGEAESSLNVCQARGHADPCSVCQQCLHQTWFSSTSPTSINTSERDMKGGAGKWKLEAGNVAWASLSLKRRSPRGLWPNDTGCSAESHVLAGPLFLCAEPLEGLSHGVFA